jgi:CysZ protein
VLRAFTLALAQLSDPAFRRLILIGLALSLLLLAGLATVIALLLAHAVPTDWGWAQAPVALLGGAASLVLAWILFPAISAVAAGLLAEPIARAVERRHYPTAPPSRSSGVLETVGQTIRLVLLGLLINTLALALVLPIYLFVPGVNLAVFVALNGYLIGREYFETAAIRHFPAAETRRRRRRNRAMLWLAGAGLAVLLTIPLVNLLVPYVGLAAMIHLVERERNANRATDLV